MSDRPNLLQRAEQLWEDLQENNLGGFSGINRPFWIVQAFKEVESAAIDKARREALPTAQTLAWALMEARHIPEQARGDSDVQAAAIKEAQEILRVLTPQNPGDAAPQKG